MNRNQKSAAQRDYDKAKAEIERLSPQAIRYIEKYCRLEAEEKLDLYKKLVDDAVFNVMRSNRVGEERAYRIMEQANSLIVKEAEKKVS